MNASWTGLVVAEPQILTTLAAKRTEIERYVSRIEKQLAAARHDLAHVNATIRLFEMNGEHSQFPVYVQMKRMFTKGELPRLCREAIEASPEGQLDTRQLANAVMLAKSWDATDKALAVSVSYRITHVLGTAAQTGKFGKAGKRNGANLWRLPE